MSGVFGALLLHVLAGVGPAHALNTTNLRFGVFGTVLCNGRPLARAVANLVENNGYDMHLLRRVRADPSGQFRVNLTLTMPDVMDVKVCFEHDCKEHYGYTTNIEVAPIESIGYNVWFKTDLIQGGFVTHRRCPPYRLASTFVGLRE